MKIKELEITTVELEDFVTKHLVCDICGVKKEGGHWGPGENTSKTWDESIEITCRYYHAEVYTTGRGESLTKDIDICPKCFDGKLIPWIESFGFRKVEDEECGWD